MRGFDEKILSMYGLGLSTKAIQEHLKDICNIEVSPELISRVTDEVKGQMSKKAVYLALAIKIIGSLYTFPAIFGVLVIFLFSHDVRGVILYIYSVMSYCFFQFNHIPFSIIVINCLHSYTFWNNQILRLIVYKDTFLWFNSCSLQ